MTNKFERATLGVAKDAPSLYCWFVEDDGEGQSGYDVMDGRLGGGPTAQRGGLFSTIGQIKEALKNQDIKTPYLVPHYPARVPQGWRIRSLTTNEVDQLGLSYNCQW